MLVNTISQNASSHPLTGGQYLSTNSYTCLLTLFHHGVFLHHVAAVSIYLRLIMVLKLITCTPSKVSSLSNLPPKFLLQVLMTVKLTKVVPSLCFTQLNSTFVSEIHESVSLVIDVLDFWQRKRRCLYMQLKLGTNKCIGYIT